MTEQTDRPARRRRMPVWFFMFLLALASVSLLLHAAKLRRQGDVQGLCDQEAMMTVARPVEETKARRARFYETQYYLGYPMSLSYAVADLIRRSDGILRPLRLLGVQVDAGLQVLKFKLTVGVAAAGPEAAWRKFIDFFNELRNLPGVTQASYSRPGRGDGLHVFSISGEAEWQ